MCCHKTKWRRAPALREKKMGRKKWNESTKRAKESEKRDLKSRWVRLKREKKGKGLFNTMNLFYSKPYVYEE